MEPLKLSTTEFALPPMDRSRTFTLFLTPLDAAISSTVCLWDVMEAKSEPLGLGSKTKELLLEETLETILFVILILWINALTMLKDLPIKSALTSNKLNQNAAKLASMDLIILAIREKPLALILLMELKTLKPNLTTMEQLQLLSLFTKTF